MVKTKQIENTHETPIAIPAPGKGGATEVPQSTWLSANTKKLQRNHDIFLIS